MPVPPDRQSPNYDRWTFDRWAVQRVGRRRARRRLVWGCAAGFVLLMALSGAWLMRPHLSKQSPSSPVQTHPVGALMGVTVILDPGHGGEDPGASLRWGRQTIHEASLTYRTAAEVAEALRWQGAAVRYTVRSRLLDAGAASQTPTLPTDAVLVATGQPLRLRVRRSPRLLWARAALARQVWDGAVRRDPHAARDVFFLSLHYDDCRDPAVHGGLVCVDRRGGAAPAFGQALAGAMRARGWARPDAGTRQADVASHDLGVLNPRFNPVPQRALLEVATLSNMDDFFRAADPAWRAQVAQMVTQAVLKVHRGS